MTDSLQYRDTDGKLLYIDGSPGDGALARECCEDFPQECPTGLADQYHIAEYRDGDFQIDDCLCQNAGQEAVPWLGTFDWYSSCYWSHYGLGDTSISGRVMHWATLALLWGPPPRRGYWEVIILCYPGVNIVWRGRKDRGMTPEGEYTRTEGCDTTASLTIVTSA